MPRFEGQSSINLGLKHQTSRGSIAPIRDSDDDFYSKPYHESQSLEESMKWFNNQKQKLASQKRLFEDPFFKAEEKSLFFSQQSQKRFVWKRPKDIGKNPEFILEGASRFDVRQGELGDCWLLAAVASLSLNKDLFNQVVPENQEFNRNYVGAFLFRFWQFGRWRDVVVDDRLPTNNNRLTFMHSTDSNEYWSALLEKAYAKMASSYEALKGGSTCEAMEDFTGGITELFEMGSKSPPNLWEVLSKAQNRCSLMGCSIEADPNEIEAKGEMGLIKGHAYSVTSIQTARSRKGETRLVRIRNPWGNEREWTGAWSDKSREWNEISESEKKKLGLSFEDDGEFWMCFEDFIRYFTKLEICHLSPETDTETAVGSAKKRKWEMCIEDGQWSRNNTAGGCRNFIETFHMNPQFRVTVTDPDEDDDENKGTLIVGLMQADMRSKRKEGGDFWTIGYAIYKLKDARYESERLDTKFFRTNASTCKSPAFINMREVCGRHKLDPGKYVIVPSTFKNNEEAKFILRIFSEQPNTSEELDQKTDIVDIKKNIQLSDEEERQQAQSTAKLRKAFEAIAGEDMEIDSDELRDILNAAFKRENFKFDGFSKETCRSMVAMMDVDMSGKLGFSEFKDLWDDIRLWKTVFKKFDADKSGNFNTYELRTTLNHVGFKVSNKIFNAITTRYSRKDGIITFDDYILLLVRLRTVFLTFKAQPKTRTGEAVFKQDDFIQCITYV